MAEFLIKAKPHPWDELTEKEVAQLEKLLFAQGVTIGKEKVEP